MKKVFIVFAEVDYDRRVLGVYKKKKDARKRLIELESFNSDEYDLVFLTAFALDDEADYLI